MSLHVANVCRLKACWLPAQGNALGKRGCTPPPNPARDSMSIEIGNVIHHSRGVGDVCAAAHTLPPRNGVDGYMDTHTKTSPLRGQKHFVRIGFAVIVPTDIYTIGAFIKICRFGQFKNRCFPQFKDLFITVFTIKNIGFRNTSDIFIRPCRGI